MKIISSIILFLITSNCLATGVDGTKISRILVGPEHANNAIISLTKKPDVPGGHCRTNSTYDYVLDISTESGKATFSVLLSAFHSKRTLNFDGFNTCNLYQGIEDLRQVSIEH